MTDNVENSVLAVTALIINVLSKNIDDFRSMIQLLEKKVKL